MTDVTSSFVCHFLACRAKSTEAKEVLKSTGSKFVVVELDELPAEAACQGCVAIKTIHFFQ